MRPAAGGRHPGARRHHTDWPAPGHARNGVAPPFVVRRAGTGTPQTVVAAFAALAALVLAGQAGLRRDLRAMQTAMLAGLRNEMRAGQARLRQDLAALGVRLSVVEHRTDALETRFAGEKRPLPEAGRGLEGSVRPPSGDLRAMRYAQLNMMREPTTNKP